MNKVLNWLTKYKWYVIVYCIYASFILVETTYSVSSCEQVPYAILWLVTVPLIVFCIGYFIWNRYFRKGKPVSAANADNMSEPTEKNIFVRTWALLSFTKEFGPRMQRVECLNKETNKTFYRCVFTNPDGNYTWVDFMSYLGEPSAKEISLRKEELKVGKMENGKYYLFDSNMKVWQDVDL